MVVFHAVFIGEAQEHIKQVGRRHIAAFAKKIFRRISYKLTIAAATSNNCVDAESLHVLEILIPFGFAPVLMRNVMGDFIEESSGYGQTLLFNEKFGVLTGEISRSQRRIIACIDGFSRSFFTAGEDRWRCDCSCRTDSNFFKEVSTIGHNKYMCKFGLNIN